eukprot:scaffold18099_cov67-Skeletonema_dohrnii-CCMP3373.AAC.1
MRQRQKEYITSRQTECTLQSWQARASNNSKRASEPLCEAACKLVGSGSLFLDTRDAISETLLVLNLGMVLAASWQMKIKEGERESAKALRQHLRTQEFEARTRTPERAAFIHHSQRATHGILHIKYLDD